MFLHRLFSTVVLLALLAGMIFLPQMWRTSLFYLVSILMTALLIREITAAMKNMGMNTFEKILPYLGGVCSVLTGLVLIRYKFPLSGIVVVVPFFALASVILVILGILFSANDPEKIRKIFHSLIVLVYVLVPVALIQIIYAISELKNEGMTDIIMQNNTCNIIFLYFILMTKIGDIGAYVTGTLSNKLLKGGNHKMIPSISPGKSWEGMFGGLIISVLFSILFGCIAKWDYPLWILIVSGVVLYFAGMAGDLAESSFKRAANIKDSGHIFPGIGGVYDLVDSLFLAAPFFLMIMGGVAYYTFSKYLIFA